MIIKGVTYVSRQVSTMCLCQTGFPVHASNLPERRSNCDPLLDAWTAEPSTLPKSTGVDL